MCCVSNRINRRAGTTVYWRCFFRWCRANAVVENGKLKSTAGKHICPQPLANPKVRQQQMPPSQSVSQSAASATAVKKSQAAAQQRRSSTTDQNGIKMATRNGKGAAKATRSQKQKPATTTTNNNSLSVKRKSQRQDVEKAQNGHAPDENASSNGDVKVEDCTPSPSSIKQVTNCCTYYL